MGFAQQFEIQGCIGNNKLINKKKIIHNMCLGVIYESRETLQVCHAHSISLSLQKSVCICECVWGWEGQFA